MAMLLPASIASVKNIGVAVFFVSEHVSDSSVGRWLEPLVQGFAERMDLLVTDGPPAFGPDTQGRVL